MAYFRDLWGAPDDDQPQGYFAGAARALGIPLPPDVDPGPPLPFFAGAARALRLGQLPLSDVFGSPPLPSNLAGLDRPLTAHLASGTGFGDFGEEQVAQGGAPRGAGQSSPASPPSEEDVQLLARLIFAEGADQWKVPGAMEGIGSVVRNRVGGREFKNTLADVIYQPGAFAGVNSPLWNVAEDPASLTGPNARAYRRALEVARDVLEGSTADPTSGATFFNSDPRKKVLRPGEIDIGKLRFKHAL